MIYPKGNTTIAWKQLDRRGEGFFECVRGTDKNNTGQVIYLFRVNDDAVGSMWVAGLGPHEAYYDVVATAAPVFGGGEDNILKAGSHEWLWQPCRL
ncbi:MAG: hypothetical protein ACKPKO_62650 [Candidatus Fonsibacter sp.]